MSRLVMLPNARQVSAFLLLSPQRCGPQCADPCPEWVDTALLCGKKATKQIIWQ